MTLCNCFNKGLLRAVQNSDVDAVKVMLSCGADPNYFEGAALVYAASGGSLQIMQLLLDHKGDLQSRGGEAAPYVAESKGHSDVAKLLRSRIKSAAKAGPGRNL